MRSTFAVLAFAASALAVANPMPQAVTSAIAPSSSPPAGCSTSYSGSFQIDVVNVTKSSKRDMAPRDSSGNLIITLANGILTDDQGRTGYIASNYQFQFDKPAQAGAIYTSGWSVCSNGSLALGGSAVFYECLSGTFYNLYLDNEAAQCAPIYIDVVPLKGSTSTVTGAAGVTSDGQATATPVTAICQLSDGQPQATNCASTTAPVVSQKSDGQPQASTQATTAAVVSVKTDGQPTQAATSSSPAAVASTASRTGYVISSSAAASASASRTSAAAYTGAAMPTAAVRGELFGLAAGVLAVAML